MKTLVPSNHQIVHMFRSDWTKKITVDYVQSPLIFKNISNNGPIHTDAQFAFWIYKQFGVGEYFVMAWKMGRKGWWNFMKVLCQADGFMRLPKKETQIDKEKRELVAEYRKFNRQLNKSQDELEKEEIKEEMQDILDYKEFVKKDAEFECSSKHGCYPYLSSVQPIYKFHEYQSLEDENVLVSSASKEKESQYKVW